MPNNTLQEELAPLSALGLSGESDFDARQLFALIRAGKITILIVTLIALMFGGLYCLFATRVYKADGLVQVEGNSSKGVSSAAAQLSDISTLLQGAPLETQAEIQVLGSRMVFDEVIEKLNLLVFAEPKVFPLIGAAVANFNSSSEQPVKVPAVLRSYAWGGEHIAVSSFDVPEAFFDSAFTLKKTEDGYIIKLGAHRGQLQGKVGELASQDTPDGHFSVFVQELKANPGTLFKLIKHSQQTMLDQLSERYTVAEQGKQSGVIALTFEGNSPEFVTEVINNIEGAYLRKEVERRSATAQQSLEFLEQQLPKLKAQVEQAQLQFKAYQSSHGSVNVSEETELVLKQSVELETQRLKLEQQKEEALQKFTSQHPVVKALDEQLASLGGAQDKVKQQTGKLPSTQQEILSLKRDLDVNTELYTQMLNSVQELQIAKAGTIGNVRIIDPALKPKEPIRPRVPQALALSLVAGLILSLAVVFAQRALLRGVDDPTEVESHFGLPTYAMIPFSEKQRRLQRGLIRGASDNYILAALEPADTSIEALRSLRTSLHFAMLESTNNVIMLTGPAPSLGKSFVTVNLAAVLAMADKRVLVIDADLRKGHLHRYVGAAANPGISDYVVGNADLNSVIHPSPVAGLDIIFRGTIPPNPSELLLHERFTELIKILSVKYDYVLIDTPPVLAVTDASIVGRLAGCTLVLLKSAEHPLREIDEMLKRLASAGVRVKGTLFNQVGARAGSYGYGNYGYSYYQYESRSAQKEKL